jgi:shikimate kinase
MGSRHVRTEAIKARPILNERDYQNAKALVAREMQRKHSERVAARIEALMQEVAEYERRFLEGEEEDAARWVEYAYASALEENETPLRRWSDASDD